MDHERRTVEARVVEERPLTIFLNAQEIVTAMTIGDFPEYLAVGYLLNQGMLRRDDVITGIDCDGELETVVVRTERVTDYEEKLRKKTRTSGCAVGTVFGDVMEGLAGVRLPEAAVRTSELYALAQAINTTPTSISRRGRSMERCSAGGRSRWSTWRTSGGATQVDKIAGWMALQGIGAADKLLYTTGRLTSEMVIKTALMGIPVLASRSGFTAWGVEIAREVGLTLIGRMRGRRFLCLAGAERLVWDADPAAVPEEAPRHRRKAAEDAA